MSCKIKEIRKKLGMTQTDLAEKSGVSRGTIAALEAGTARNTTSGTLVKLAKALGVEVEAIFYS